MRLKRITVLALCAAMAVSMTGCKEKEIVVSGGGSEFVPDVRNIEVDINDIDFDQIRADMEELLTKEDYPKGSYIDFAVYPDANQINLIWVLENDATEEDALAYGPVIMRAFNDAYSTQDNSIAVAEDDSYGPIWDKWAAVLQLYRDADIMDETKYYVNQVIPAGSNAAIERYVYVEPETSEEDDADAEAEDETADESESGAGTETTVSAETTADAETTAAGK